MELARCERQIDHREVQLQSLKVRVVIRRQLDAVSYLRRGRGLDRSRSSCKNSFG